MILRNLAATSNRAAPALASGESAQLTGTDECGYPVRPDWPHASQSARPQARR
jgi:hypothetical protein